jgi:hypothetical protein
VGPHAFRKRGVATGHKREPKTPPLTVPPQSTQRPLSEAGPRGPTSLGAALLRSDIPNPKTNKPSVYR